jgi:YD repeat-containing protein
MAFNFRALTDLNPPATVGQSRSFYSPTLFDMDGGAYPAAGIATSAYPSDAQGRLPFFSQALGLGWTRHDLPAEVASLSWIDLAAGPNGQALLLAYTDGFHTVTVTDYDQDGNVIGSHDEQIPNGTNRSALWTGSGWQVVILPATGTWESVGWNGSKYCAVLSPYQSATSPDGVTWTMGPASNGTDGVYLAGKPSWNGAVWMLAIGNIMSISADGLHWATTWPKYLDGQGNQRLYGSEGIQFISGGYFYLFHWWIPGQDIPSIAEVVRADSAGNLTPLGRLADFGALTSGWGPGHGTWRQLVNLGSLLAAIGTSTDGTNAIVSFSHDGGLTWMAPTTASDLQVAFVLGLPGGNAGAPQPLPLGAETDRAILFGSQGDGSGWSREAHSLQYNHFGNILADRAISPAGSVLIFDPFNTYRAYPSAVFLSTDPPQVLVAPVGLTGTVAAVKTF